MKAFTLFELLIVIFIIGILSTLVVLKFRAPTYEYTAQTYSQEILRYMQVTQEEAIMRTKVLGIKFSKHNFQVFELKTKNDNTQEWVALSERNKFWNSQIIPQGINLSLQPIESSVDISKFVPLNRPEVLFLPGGEMTPFILQVEEQGNNSSKYLIQGDESGNLRIR